MIQNQFINKILSTKDKNMITVNNLTVDYFTSYPREFEFIKHHIDEYNAIPDVETFIHKFPDFDLIDVQEPVNFLLDSLYEDKNKRDLANVFNSVRNLILENKVDDAMNLYMSSTDSLVKAKHLDSIDILDDTSRYEKFIEKCNDFNKYYVKTGLKELDQIIGGWDRLEELATISARPGVGKTFLSLKMAIEAARQGLTVGFYSGEMTEDKIAYRIDTLISHLPNYKLIHGDRSIQNEYKEYLDSIKQLIPGKFKVLTPKAINGPAGVTALRAFIEKDNLDILFVDQHSLLEDDRKAKSPVEKAANISRDLKNLQVMKRIPIIAISQQNRSDTSAGIGTEHIAQSDRISQDSTTIIFIEQKDSVMTLTLAKSRDSITGKKLKYAVDLNTGTFNYIPEDLDAESAEQLRDEFENHEPVGEDVF